MATRATPEWPKLGHQRNSTADIPCTCPSCYRLRQGQPNYNHNRNHDPTITSQKVLHVMGTTNATDAASGLAPRMKRRHCKMHPRMAVVGVELLSASWSPWCHRSEYWVVLGSHKSCGRKQKCTSKPQPSSRGQSGERFTDRMLSGSSENMWGNITDVKFKSRW